MVSEQNVAVHFVTVTSNGEDMPATVKFECRGNRDSKCHSYPNCECEYWDDEHEQEHPFVQHDECWMQGWFDNNMHVYDGPDGYDMRDNCVPDGMNRSGEISACYDLDGFVEWQFKGVSR